MPATTPGTYPLTQADFVIVGGTATIEAPDTLDVSFSKDGGLVIPSSQTISSSVTIFTFNAATLPDTLHAHTPIAGDTGRSLPIQQLIQTLATLHTDSYADASPSTPPDAPRRTQNGSQDDSVQMPVDGTVIKASIAWKEVFFSGNSIQQNNLKMPVRCPERQFCTTTSTSDAPPMFAQAEIFTTGHSTMFGGRLVETSWEPTVPSSIDIGEPWATAGTGDSMIRMHRDSSECYTMVVDASPMTSLFMSLGGTWRFRTRYAEGLDEHGRVEWHGWSPVVEFTVNTSPTVPVGLAVRFPTE